MSEPVFVAAIWSIAHASWVEFIVSPDQSKVRGICRLLTDFTATHVRVVRVASDDWELIRPALAALGDPPKSYSPRELELMCDWRSYFGSGLIDGSEADDAGVAPVVAKPAAVDPDVVPFERRRAGRRGS